MTASSHTHDDDQHLGNGHGHDEHDSCDSVDPCDGGSRIAAWVDGHAVRVDDVRRREEALRAGEFAARLPVRRTPQGRNVVRWIVQLMATEHIIEAEARRRRLTTRPGARLPPLDVASALELGGVLATVLSSMPLAVAVRDCVTSEMTPTETSVRSYYALNLDRFTQPEARVVETTIAGTRVRSRIVRGELPPAQEQRVFTAAPHDTVAVSDTWTLTVVEVHPEAVEPFDQVRPWLTAELRRHERDRWFGEWVRLRQHHLVRLAPGFEHPGDPHHADATHRH